MPSPEATGHSEETIFQTAAQPSLDNLKQIAGDERNHPDAVGCHHNVQGAGNRTADESLDT